MIKQSCRGGNEDVVHINDDTGPLCEKAELDLLEYLVHHGLKGTRGVGQTEEHNPWFKKAIFGFKRRFLFVPCFDPDVIVTPSHVKLGEDICILYLTDKVLDEWKGVSVPDRVFVQLPVILYQLEFTVFLLYKEEG